MVPPVPGNPNFGPIAFNNPEVFEAPVEIFQDVPVNDQQADAEFGADFPGLIEAPLLSEDALLEDPVTSGGDSSLYAQDDPEDDEDDAAPVDDPSGEGEE